MSENFSRIRIDDDTPWWRRPDYEYMLQLDRYCATLEKKVNDMRSYIRKLKGELARSGNAYYLADAKKALKEHAGLTRRVAEAEAKVIQLTMENNYLRGRCEALEKNLKPETKVERLANGQFYSEMPKAEKCKVAYDLECSGWEHEQIAAELQIAVDSVRKYIAEHKKKLEKDEGEITYWWQNNE